MKLAVLSLFMLFLLTASPKVDAQNIQQPPRKLTFGVEVAHLVVISESYTDNTILGNYYKLCFGYNYSPHLYLGISAGLNTYTNDNSLATLPVELEVKGTLLNKPVTPVAYIKGGYSFERPNEGNYGYVYSSGIGYRFKMGNRARFTPLIGFNYQQVHSYAMFATAPGELVIEKAKVDPINSIIFAVRFEF